MKATSKLDEVIYLANKEVTTIEDAQARMKYMTKLLREFLVDNATVSKAKRDLYALCSKEEYRPIMTGVYHDEEGFAVASDACILVASKADYREEYSGKIIDKYGNEIEGRYPNWKSVFPSTTGSSTVLDVISLPSIDELAEIERKFKAYTKEWNARGNKNMSKTCTVSLAGGKVFLRLDLLIKFTAWTDKATVWAFMGTPSVISFDNDEARGILMPQRLPEDNDADFKAVMWCGDWEYNLETVEYIK